MGKKQRVKSIYFAVKKPFTTLMVSLCIEAGANKEIFLNIITRTGTYVYALIENLVEMSTCLLMILTLAWNASSHRLKGALYSFIVPLQICVRERIYSLMAKFAIIVRVGYFNVTTFPLPLYDAISIRDSIYFPHWN